MGKTRSELREKIMVILYQIDIYNERKLPYEIDEVIKNNVDIENPDSEVPTNPENPLQPAL